ncbi:VanZ family protein [Aquabacterium sp. OR-4]|uniref:VanZ family protein n=1 Tax=Aquabacterium sp. OR-4 TaxID=2978127 RepID=UPI0021B4B740|nr:VanZ family protein [Aquabacterium sp. OR-4]MDT7834266.1 VanZ family protein [Aquabacterium sp. OR-4]
MPGPRGRHASTAVPLALAWAATIVYASLFPFTGWRWPVGLGVAEMLRLPWPQYFIPFDITSNLGGYLPLGLLVALARLRHGAGRWSALAGGVLAGAALSYGLEVSQHLLSQRVPSLLDWLLNSLGALAGALLAVLAALLGLLRGWQATRERWLEGGQSGAVALLLLWPVALLFPTPVPLGLGQVGGALRDWLFVLLLDVPWAQSVTLWLDSAPVPSERLSPLAEGLAVALGLLAPCLLAYAASRRGWRRLGLALGATLLALLATTLSTTLNFGPDHALAWAVPDTLVPMAVGLVLALMLAWLGARAAAALALVAFTGLVMLVHQAPSDPYFAQSLQGWEQGRFIRFHGLAQWLGWLWPYGALAWLLVRLGGTRRV